MVDSTHYHLIYTQDNVVRVYSVSGDSLTEKTTIETTDEISAVAYSPTGEFLAVTSGRSVCTYETASFQVKIRSS